MSTCGNPQHSSACKCGLNLQGISRVHELQKAYAESVVSMKNYQDEIERLLKENEEIRKHFNEQHPGMTCQEMKIAYEFEIRNLKRQLEERG